MVAAVALKANIHILYGLFQRAFFATPSRRGLIRGCEYAAHIVSWFLTRKSALLGIFRHTIAFQPHFVAQTVNHKNDRVY